MLVMKLQKIAVNGKSTINVALADGEALDEVVLVGSRTAPRSNVDTHYLLML